MSIIVTGSIAFDYLMSFPGKFTEHFLPEHMSRVSLSFLVDSMDKRRGGCAPNIAYTLALLGERPKLMATAGQDFEEYRRWLDAAGVDTSLVRDVPGKFTASFFCSTDVENNQIASFYTARWRTPRSCRSAPPGPARSRSCRRTIRERCCSTPRNAAR
jgi:adenosine kinase